MTRWVVDGMNVIGSRPTGWWHDRPGAMHDLIRKALTPRKKRVATKPSKAAKEKRLQFKKRLSEKKQQRRGEM